MFEVFGCFFGVQFVEGCDCECDVCARGLWDGRPVVLFGELDCFVRVFVFVGWFVDY